MGSRKNAAIKTPTKRAGKTSIDGAKVRKPRRNHPGTVAKRMIRKQSRMVTPEYAKKAVERLVREIAQDQDVLDKGIRFQKKSLDVFNEICMHITCELMMTGADAMEHAGRATLMPKDLYVDKEFRKFGEVLFERMQDPNYDGPITEYIPRELHGDRRNRAIVAQWNHKKKRGLLKKKELLIELPTIKEEPTPLRGE